jgi:diaminopimelate decarboxylase
VTAPDQSATNWWRHSGLTVAAGRLAIAGRDAEGLAREYGTPLYVYDLTRIDENVEALREALPRQRGPWRILVALKALREPPFLARLRTLGPAGTLGTIGLDVCSPGEVEHALANGFLPSELSYTGTNLSDRDLDVILRHRVHVNLDLLTQIHRYGRKAPGTAVGLRVNPRVGVVSSSDTTHVYSGELPTKFGIYPERLDEAAAAAARYGLVIDTVHFHVAHQLTDGALPQFEKAVIAAAGMVRRLKALGCPVKEVNAGGGLSAPSVARQTSFDLAGYAAILERHLRPLDVAIAIESGEYFCTDAGALLSEVVTVEDRSAAGDGSALFAGLDCGWNIMNVTFVYHESAGVVLCRAADAPPRRHYTVTGHINEGPDVFAVAEPLPELREGDIVALLGVGAYCQAQWHEHCLRPFPEVLWLEERLAIRPDG